MNIRQWQELVFRLDQIEQKIDTLTNSANGSVAAPLVLDILEAAALLRVGRSTVYELMNSGELESVKIGRRRLLTYASCAAYVENARGAS